MSMIDQLRENPSTLEFLAHPDLRQVCTFFLGATFFSAAVGITQSRAFGRLQVLLDQLLFPRRRQPFMSLESPNEQPRHLEVPPTGTTEKLRDWSGRFPLSEAQLRVDPLNLLFFLTLFVALAALSLFGSVLQFSSTSETGCAFIVAWAGLSSQCVRIIGLFHLSLELQNVGARRMEKYTVWIVLFLSFVLMFVTNALSTGTLREVKAVTGYFLCYRRHFAPTAIITSIINILLEIWLLVRFFMLAVPKFFRLRDQLGSLYDGRLRKGGSLLLLDLLTLVPSAMPVAITADIIPFCVGALFVLAAFNRVPKSNASDALTFSIPPSSTQSHIGTFVTQVRSPLSETTPSSTSPISTTVHFARPSLSPSNGHNRSSMLSIPPALPPKRPQLAHILTSGSYNMPGHPYAAGHEPEYVRANERISVLSSDSAVAHSVAGAVVSFAFHQGAPDRSSMAPLPTGQSNRASMYSPPAQDRPAGFSSFPPPPSQPRRVSYLDIQETPVVSPLASPPSFVGSSNASDMRTISSRVPSSRRGGPPTSYDPRRLHPSYISMEDSASDDSRPTAPSFVSQEPRPTAPSIMSEDALSFSDALQRPPPTMKRDPLPGTRVADIRQMHRASVRYSDQADPAQNASHRLSPMDVPSSPADSVMSSPEPLPLDPRGVPLYRD